MEMHRQKRSEAVSFFDINNEGEKKCHIDL